MKRKIGLILFFILFSSPLFLVFGDESLDLTQREDMEGISPESSSDSDVDEALYLISELEREIALTNKILDVREEAEPPKKPFRTSKEEILYLFEQFKNEYTLTNEMLYPGKEEEE